WEKHMLDKVRFLPMNNNDAFGFVDPTDVLRVCHIISSFPDSPLHPDRVAMSPCAGDVDNWKCYCVNCFVDRMRYHWGLGIGHTYSHTQST
ncbi:hypothetical protein V8E55_006719, partial [Tylopilus felleus]